RRVDRSGIERIQTNVGNAEGRAITVPHLGECLTTVCRLVHADRVRAGLESLRLASLTDYMRESPHRERGADEEVLRVGRIDDDLVNPAAQEGVARVRTRVGRIADTGVRQLRPRIAAIRGLVYTDAGFAPGGTPVSLARPDVEGVPARVVGICDESADGVESEDAGQPCPARICREGVVRPPNAAAGGASPEAAVPWHACRSDD